MSLRPVGILGGMGPEATILLQQRLMKATPARDDADHVPLLIDMNPQVPSRIAHLIEGTGTDPGPVLAAMARRLETAGAVALAMPCNTAHHYAPAIRAAVSVPFLDMIAASADTVAARTPKGAAIGVLASPATRRTGLFERALAARGRRALWPEDMDALLAAIREIKSQGPTDASRAALSRASGELTARGAALHLVGCSEFSLVAEAASTPRLDTVDVLVDAIDAAARGEVRNPSPSPTAQ
ncbi:aspartate/glutamate racemase family protein [Rhodobacteraceae bacterium CCMM004]|nr:aspartate/glutamate racemase family protein [Rhodobacteraceae bacterium CCMM004]